MDVATITETKLNKSSSSNSLKITGYDFNRVDRNRNGGGVLTYISLTLSPTEVTFLQDKYNKLGIEVTVSRISTRSVKLITILGVYRPPSARKDWFTTFNALLQEVAPWGPTIILGDLNADLLVPFSFPGNCLMESLALVNVCVADVFPTRITDHSATCLDIIAIDQSIPCVNYSLVDCAASDHFPVVAEINLVGNYSIKPVVKRNFKNVDEAALHHDLGKIALHPSGQEDVNSLLGNWYSQYNNILDKHAPFKSYPFKKNFLPWISQGTKTTMHLRDDIARKMRATRRAGDDSSIIYEELKTLRKRVKGQLKSDLKLFGADTMKSNDHNKIWGLIRSTSFTVAKGQASRIDPHLMNDHFASVVFDHADGDLQPVSQPDTPDAFQIEAVSVEEVCSLLQSTKSSSAAGHDGISGWILKTYANSLSPSISVLINASINQTVFPDEWKKSNVVPIWKSKGSKADPSSYRPISIIPVMGKILEKVVANQLSKFCNERSVIPLEQYGFREKSSVEVALLSATNQWVEEIDEGKMVGVLMIDLAKAFDTVSHQQLLLELSAIHCCTNALLWFQSFLNNRGQRVSQDGTLTTWKPVSRGVPQGSCLSPLLFNILVRELPRAVAASTWQFADDITHSVSSDKVETIKEELSNVYLSTKSFCSSKRLDVNLAKSQFIIFKSPSRKLPEVVTIDLDSQSFPALAHVKLLGVILDRHLTFKDHISTTVNTCNGLLGVLRRIAGSLPRKLCSLFYTAIIRSHLEFASCLLVPVATSHLDKLDVVQRKAARIICLASPDSHAEPLLDSLGWASLEDRRTKHLVKLVSQILSLNCHPSLVNLFEPDTSSEFGPVLQVPKTRTLMGKKRFGVFGADIFNSYMA